MKIIHVWCMYRLKMMAPLLFQFRKAWYEKEQKKGSGEPSFAWNSLDYQKSNAQCSLCITIVFYFGGRGQIGPV